MKKWYDEEYEFNVEVTGFLHGDHTERYCRIGEEAGDKARGRAADFLGERTVQQTDEEAVERTRHKALNKRQHRADIQRDDAHLAGNADAEALQKAEQSEDGSRGESAYRSERDG